jgi:hypothetical protein
MMPPVRPLPSLLGKSPFSAEAHAVKPFLLGFLLLDFLFLAVSPLFGQANPPLATPHFELHQPYDRMKPPMGVLGLPLGTFAVIEGTEHHTSKFWGSEDFVIESINGKKLEHEVRIMTNWPSQLPDKRISGKRYILHGYEGGEWAGQPDGLPGGEHSGWTQSGGFLFQQIFAVTSVEKVDGVTVAEARPLDPKVPLAEPHFAAKPDDPRPIGLLGLPLGTFAIIEVHSPKEVMMEMPFVIDAVNGVHMKSPRSIFIPELTLPKNTEEATVRGFETGQWAGDPVLPKSEFPSAAPLAQTQTSFGFSTQFVLTTPVKSATPAQSPPGI